MKTVYESVELMSITPQSIFLIERAGRTCYKSEDKMECLKCSGDVCSDCLERATKFVKMIIDRGHHSVLEHANATIKFITDRGMTHELVRHRLCAYSQESTRYCNYGNKGGEITVIRPPRFTKAKLSPEEDESFTVWQSAMESSEQAYLRLIKLGASPQFARSVLPTCLKTEIVTTTNLRQWRHIIQLRALNTKAHPQIRAIMKDALDPLNREIPVAFEDLAEAWVDA